MKGVGNQSMSSRCSWVWKRRLRLWWPLDKLYINNSLIPRTSARSDASGSGKRNANGKRRMKATSRSWGRLVQAKMVTEWGGEWLEDEEELCPAATDCCALVINPSHRLIHSVLNVLVASWSSPPDRARNRESHSSTKMIDGENLCARENIAFTTFWVSP